MYHAPIGKGFFLPWLTLHFWVGKIRFFSEGPVWRRKTAFFGFCSVFLHLGGGENLHTKDCYYA